MIKLNEHGRFKKKSMMDPVKVDRPEHLVANRDKSVRWIENIPVTGSGLYTKTQAEISDSSDNGHLFQSLKISEPIALGVIRRPLKDWSYQLRNVRAIHLVIAVNLDRNSRVKLKGFFKTRKHGAAHALIMFVF